MPIVNIKGVGKAQFPDNMTAEQIKGFLRQKYPSQQALQSSVSLEPKPQTIEATNPSLAQRGGQAIADILSDTGLISNRSHAQNIGSNLTALGEFLPVVGDATAGDEFGKAVKEGDAAGIGLGALGVIPIVGDVAKGGIKGLKKAVDALGVEYKAVFAPLQAEFRAGVTPARKVEILNEAKRLRAPLDAAKSSLFRAEQAAKPKIEKIIEKEVPNKTFKGKVFHQTAEDFNDFDFNKSADGTIWFTGDKKNFSDPSSSASAASGKAKILERDIELNKVAGFDELDKFSIGELKQQGYDGAVLDGDIQVFDPKAIKEQPLNVKTADKLKEPR